MTNFKNYYEQNLKETKQKIKDSVNDDNLIIQTINCIEELDKTSNLLLRRLREWYELYNPEFSKKFADNNKFIEILNEKTDKKNKTSMGSDLSEKELEPIYDLAKQIKDLYELQDRYDRYLEIIMKRHCPNITYIAGCLIAAKLLEHAGSLKRLSIMTASTIQLLGAEKALFRHMKTGARSPKHGIILQHQFLQRSKPKNRGKAARALADKLSIAAKVDYFKGDFVGKHIKEELEKKINAFS